MFWCFSHKDTKMFIFDDPTNNWAPYPLKIVKKKNKSIHFWINKLESYLLIGIMISLYANILALVQKICIWITKNSTRLYFPFVFSKGKQKLLVSFERQDMKNPIFCCNFATRIKPKRQGLKIRDNFESSWYEFQFLLCCQENIC